MIIESNENNFFNTEIYDDLGVYEDAFPTLEWKGLETPGELDNLLGHIYNTEHTQLIAKHIGLSPHHIRIFTEGLLNSQEPNPDFVEHLKCEGPQWKEEYNRFLEKYHSLYLREEVSHLLENGTLDFAILDALENMLKAEGQIMTLSAWGEEIKKQSIIKAMTNVGLLYSEKHWSYLIVPNKVMLKFFKNLTNQVKSQMTWKEKLEYKWWRVSEGLHMADMAVNKNRQADSNYNDYKECANWDPDLYGGNYGKRADPGKEGVAFIDPGSNGLFTWESYGKLKELPVIRWTFMPAQFIVRYMFGYPDKYMHLPQKYIKEGNPDTPITLSIYSYFANKRTDPSFLPQYGSELKIGMDKLEHERAILKMAYMLENPQMFEREIKWRYVRRFIRNYNRKETS